MKTKLASAKEVALLAARRCENRHHARQSLWSRRPRDDDAAFIIHMCLITGAYTVAAADCLAARVLRVVIRLSRARPTNSLAFEFPTIGSAPSSAPGSASSY